MTTIMMGGMSFVVVETIRLLLLVMLSVQFSGIFVVGPIRLGGRYEKQLVVRARRGGDVGGLGGGGGTVVLGRQAGYRVVVIHKPAGLHLPGEIVLQLVGEDHGDPGFADGRCQRYPLDSTMMTLTGRQSRAEDNGDHEADRGDTQRH